MTNKLLGSAIYLTATSLGIVTFLYPFFLPVLEEQSSLNRVRASESPLIYTLLLVLCLVVVLFEVQSQAVDVKLIALLGMLVSMNSVLRFIEVAIPGPGGFSPIFFLILLVGYVYGARLGFVMGALTLFTSAIITGGVGPWLPGQMFAAGWVGMSARVLDWPARTLKLQNRRGEVLLLAVFGLGWGFLYGAIMNLWTWPYLTGPANQYWAPGTGLTAALQRYGLFYLTTSFVWDASMALGNMVLMLIAGSAGLRALRRFQMRFSFSYDPAPLTPESRQL